MIEIMGAEGKIENVNDFMNSLDEFSRKHSVVIQALDAELVCSKDHIVSAVEHAIRAFREGRNKADDLSIEVLLYASGERQIKEAIKKMGVKEGKSRIALVVLHSTSGIKGRVSRSELVEFIKKLGLRVNDDVLVGNKEKLKKFGITEEELGTVNEDRQLELVLERIAMVDIIK